MNLTQIIQAHSQQPITHQLLVSWLKDYKHPNMKIRQLVGKGLLQPLKRGLYVAGPNMGSPLPDPFLVANHLLGPSYVSMETALAYHGLIPERVYVTSSMTTRASRKFDTVMGTFTYTRLPAAYYALGINTTALTDSQHAMVASPEKALCDKIVTSGGTLFRSRKSAREFLLENMRMDEQALKALNTYQMLSWAPGIIKEESIVILAETIDQL